MHSSVRVYREMKFWAPVCSQRCGSCCSECCCSGCTHQSPGRYLSLGHRSTRYWMNSSVPSRISWKLCRGKRQFYFFSKTSSGYTSGLNSPLVITVYVISFDNHPRSDIDSAIPSQSSHSTYPRAMCLPSCVTYTKSSKNCSNDLHTSAGKQDRFGPLKRWRDRL